MFRKFRNKNEPIKVSHKTVIDKNAYTSNDDIKSDILNQFSSKILGQGEME